MEKSQCGSDLEWQTRTDSCPRCQRDGGKPGSHLPTGIETANETSLRLRYRCPKGHAWLTAWSKEVFEPRQPRH